MRTQCLTERAPNTAAASSIVTYESPVLIDRLETSWSICTLDVDNNSYEPVTAEVSSELVDELRFLHTLYGEAIATDGDVRRTS